MLRSVLAVAGLTLAGCGFSPPSAPPAATPAACTPADEPTPATVQQAIAALPVADWVETTRGHANDCRLQWVQVTQQAATASTPGQVLFFDRNTPLGTPTPDPRPYLTVVPAGADTVTVQYQWLVGDEPNCCPTGRGTTRFRIGDDGTLEALDPIPDP